MVKYHKSPWGPRRKLKKCKECGGQVWEYAAAGFLPKVQKCDECGSGE